MQDNPKIAQDANAKIECQAILILRELSSWQSVEREYTNKTIESQIILGVHEILA